jgi:general secretion pathway protein K
MSVLLNNNRGMALLLTVLIISIIVVVTLEFNTTMRSDLQAAANLRDGVKLDYNARSAFNLARTILQIDARDSDIDTLRESWAKLPMLAEYSADYLDQGRFELEIADQSGRIQINALVYAADDKTTQLQRELLARLLQSEEFGLDEEQVQAIIAALIDWLDADDEVTGFGGAENSYYQALEKPYSCRNGPIESLEELLYIKGIDRKLFYGTEERPGLSRFVTPYGNDGKVNLNTAEPLVLRALAEPIDKDLAEEMVAYREDEDNDLTKINWYKSVPSFPGDVEIPAELLTVQSSYFEIRARAYLGTMNRTVTGVIRRDEGSTAVVAWKTD